MSSIHDLIRTAQLNAKPDEQKWLSLILYKAYLMGREEASKQSQEIVERVLERLQLEEK